MTDTELTAAETCSAERAEIDRLTARVAALEKERAQLVAVTAILREVSTAPHFGDMLQTIVRRLGDASELDRCAILFNDGTAEARLLASYEDPTLKNVVVDLERYPELRRAFESGETVFIPDAVSEPMLGPVHGMLDSRGVRAIVVVPIRSNDSVIGALFLRTRRDRPLFSDDDVRFGEVVASITAEALRNAHAFESTSRAQASRAAEARRRDAERAALIEFMRRLLTTRDWTDGPMPGEQATQIDRIVSEALPLISGNGAH